MRSNLNLDDILLFEEPIDERDQIDLYLNTESEKTKRLNDAVRDICIHTFSIHDAPFNFSGLECAEIMVRALSDLRFAVATLDEAVRKMINDS